MKIEYSPDYDVMNIKFLDKKIEESVELEEGVIIDYSKNREIISIEILDASKRIGLDTFDLINFTIEKQKKILKI
jgi:uncharacterized protein YuzE